MKVKKELTVLISLFSLLLPSTLWAGNTFKLNHCNIMHNAFTRIQNSKHELEVLYEWRSMAMEVIKIQQEGFDEKYYSGFQQILSAVQNNINAMVGKQREDIGDIKNASFAAVFLALLIYKDVASKIKFSSFVDARRSWIKNHTLKASILVAFGFALYTAGKNLQDVADRAEEIAAKLEFIDKLSGMEIKQEDIIILESIIQEDEQKLSRRIQQYTIQGKIKSAGYDQDGKFYCNP